MRDKFLEFSEGLFYFSLFWLWVTWTTEWFGWAKWNDIALGSFYWIFNNVFHTGDLKYYGAQHDSLGLGYWAQIFFELTILSLLIWKILRINNRKEIPAGILKTFGIVALNVVLFEIGIFATQTWSCSGQKLYPYFSINILQWISMNFQKPDAILHCSWTMSYPVSIWSWEFSYFGWLQNWSFTLIAGIISGTFLMLRGFRKL